MSATPLIELEIDGKPVSVPAGSTIMQAANRLGIAIPHFCYHEKLSIAANCRMCLVQAEKMPKPVPACATPVTAGMKVMTQSDMAVNAQKGVMELMLINHPLDCPICDQGGECKLQDMSVGYGACESPYTEEKRVVVNKNMGPLISTDMTRCIHCTRCVRFGEEWGGFMEIGMGNRGEHSEIMTFMQATVDSEISGNAIDLCPVGALTSKPFRYTARGWELTSIESVSPHDSWGSRLRLQTRDDQVYRVLPQTTEDINQEWISDRDRFSYTALNHPERLTTPIIRVPSEGGKSPRWRQISWEEAIRQVTALHQTTPAAATQIFAHPSQSLEELSMLARAAEATGMKLATGLRRLDMNLPSGRWLGGKIKDFDRTDRVLLIGSFVRSEQPLLAARLRQAIRQGAEVSRLHVAGESWHMPLKGSFVVQPNQLVSALATLVKKLASSLNENLPSNINVLLSETSWSPANSQAIDNIVASLMSGTKRVWLGLGHYAENHPQASALALLTSTLQTLLGKSKDSAWGYLVSGANSLSAQVVGADASAQQVMATPTEIYWWYGLDGAADIANRPEILQQIAQAKGIIRFASFMPRGDAMDWLEGPTQIILPIAAFAEQEGTMINLEGRIQTQGAVVSPVGSARPGWKVIRHLCEQVGNINAAGHSNEYAAWSSLFEQDDDCEHVRQRALSRLAFGQLSRCGRWLTHLENRVTEGVAMPTPNQADQTLERIAEINLYATDPLVRRAMPLQKTRRAQESNSPIARMNPEDCAALGIRTQMNAQGALEGKVRVLSANINVRTALECAVVADCSQPTGTIILPTGHGVPFADHDRLRVVDVANVTTSLTSVAPSMAQT